MMVDYDAVMRDRLADIQLPTHCLAFTLLRYDPVMEEEKIAGYSWLPLDCHCVPKTQLVTFA